MKRCHMFDHGLHVNSSHFSPCSILPSFGQFATVEDFYNSDAYIEFKDNVSNGQYDKICMDCLYGDKLNIQDSMPTDGLVIYFGGSSECDFACHTCRSSNKTLRNTATDNLDEHKFEVGTTPTSVVDWILENQFKVTKIALVGGDPTLSREVHRLLTGIENKAIEIHYNYNGARLKFPNGDYIYDVLSRFTKVEFSTSVDGNASNFAMIRPGVPYKRVLSNLKKVHDNLSDARYTVCITISSLNIGSIIDDLPDIVRDLSFVNADIYTNQVFTPTYLSPNKVSYKDKKIIKKRLLELAHHETLSYLYRDIFKMLI